MTLYQIAVQGVQIQGSVLLHITFFLFDDLRAQRNGMFESTQPVTCVPLAQVHLEVHVVAEDDDGKQHGVCDLGGAGLEMLDALHNIAAGGAFAESSCEALGRVVREH